MQSIGSEILREQQLRANGTITCIQVLCCLHKVTKTLVATDAGDIVGLWAQADTEGACQEQVSWQLPCPAIQLVGIRPEEGTCAAVLALGQNGSAWLIRINCQYQKLVAKRQKMETGSCEEIFQTSDLIQIQPSTEGFIGLSKSSILSYNLSNRSVTTSPIPAQHHDQICLLTELNVEDLDPTLCDLLWLPRKQSVLYGTKSGAIYCRTGDSSKDTLITELVYEQPTAIHFLRLQSSMQLNAMVVLGQEGTVQLLTISDKKIARHEFYVPGPVLTSTMIKNSEALLVSLKERGQVYSIEFLPGPNSDISLQLGCLDLLDQVKQIHPKMTDNGFVLELIQKDCTLVTARTNLRKVKRNVNQSPEYVEQAIQDVLDELEQQENLRKEIDAYTEKLNTRLASVNRTIYALQRIKSQKKKLHEGEQSPFQCDVQPLVIPPSSRHLTGGASCALRIRVHTSIDLNWDKWYLHAELSNQRTLLQEKISSESKTSNSVDGSTLLMPLAGLSDDYIWERDIPVDIERLCLPVHVIFHVSTCVDLDVPSGTKLDLTEATPFMFHLSDATLDDLHFISPCTDSVMKSLEKDGIQETSAQLLGEYSRRRLLDNTNRYPLARLEKSEQILGNVEETELNLQVRVKPDMTAEETYSRIITTFLKEGRTQEEMQQIMQGQERAVFALAGFPECPIIVSLSKDMKSSSSEMISATLTLQCAHPMILLKIEAALLTRLQYLFETVEGSDQRQHGADNYKHIRRLDELASQLEDQLRTGTEDEFWKLLGVVIDERRMLYSQINIGPVSIA